MLHILEDQARYSILCVQVSATADFWDKNNPPVARACGVSKGHTHINVLNILNSHTYICMYIIYSQKSSPILNFVYTSQRCSTLYKYTYTYQTFIKVIYAHTNVRHSQKSSLLLNLVHTISAALTFQKYLPVARARGVGQDGWRQDPHSRHQQNGRPLCLPRGEILKKPIFTKPTCLWIFYKTCTAGEIFKTPACLQSGEDPQDALSW